MALFRYSIILNIVHVVLILSQLLVIIPQTYSCFSCQEGSIRYTCGECAASYDLCESCHDNGEGKRHTETCGHLHEFHVETRLVIIYY